MYTGIYIYYSIRGALRSSVIVPVVGQSFKAICDHVSSRFVRETVGIVVVGYIAPPAAN